MIAMPRIFEKAGIGAIFFLGLLTADCPGDGAAVNCGGPDFMDHCGKTWSEDTGFDGGRGISTEAEISGTIDPEPLQTARVGEEGVPLVYELSVPNGDYQLVLYFAEIEPAGPGSRLFDAEVEGFPAATDLDIENLVGPYALHAVMVPLSVQDGAADILLRPRSGAPFISAIEIQNNPVDCFRCPTIPVVEYDPDDALAGLSWLNLAPYDEIRLFRDGILLTDPPLLGVAQDFEDLEVTIGLHTYRLEVRSGEDVCSEERTIAVGCGRDLQCRAQPDGSVILRWTNITLYDEIEIRVDGLTVDSIPGNEAEYITSPLDAGEHRISLVIHGGDSSCPEIECLVDVGSELFRRGDADGNGELGLTDVIRALNFQFVGGVTMDCQDAADVDDDGELSLTDSIRSLNFQFLGIEGTIPEPPGPHDCGPDVEDDAFPPCVYANCP